MAGPRPRAESSDGPRTQPAQSEQTRYAAGTGGQATELRDDVQTAQPESRQHHPVVVAK